MAQVEIHSTIDSHINKNEKKDNKEDGGILITIIFYMFGIGTLIGTNSLLNQLNFVEYFQKRINPFLSIVLLDNFSNIPFQLVILIKKKLFNLKKQLIYSLIILSLCLILFPFMVFLFANNILGNILTLLIAIIVGLIGSLLKSGFFALGSFFPLKNIVSLSTGQGVSGILMALLGLLVRYAVNTDNEKKDLKNGALIFFGVSLLLTILTLFSLLYIYKSQYGKYHLSKENTEINNKKEIKEEHDKDIIKEHERIESKDSDNKLVQIVQYTHKKNEEHHPINPNDKNKKEIKNNESIN